MLDQPFMTGTDFEKKKKRLRFDILVSRFD